MVDATLEVSESPVSRLEAMSPAHRVQAFEDGHLSRSEMTAWAALWPEEVPLINDELPWISATLD